MFFGSEARHRSVRGVGAPEREHSSAPAVAPQGRSRRWQHSSARSTRCTTQHPHMTGITGITSITAFTGNTGWDLGAKRVPTYVLAMGLRKDVRFSYSNQYDR